jgi:FAD synthase
MVAKEIFQQIQDLADKHNFRVEKLTALKFGDEQVSSTRIRDLLSRGDIPGANNLLGYHFGMNGTVVYGQRWVHRSGSLQLILCPMPISLFRALGFMPYAVI